MTIWHHKKEQTVTWKKMVLQVLSNIHKIMRQPCMDKMVIIVYVEAETRHSHIMVIPHNVQDNITVCHWEEHNYREGSSYKSGRKVKVGWCMSPHAPPTGAQLYHPPTGLLIPHLTATKAQSTKTVIHSAQPIPDVSCWVGEMAWRFMCYYWLWQNCWNLSQRNSSWNLRSSGVCVCIN